MMSNTRECTTLFHEETVINRLLRRLDADLQRGRHLRRLPEELARAMLVTLGQAKSVDEEIEGAIALQCDAT